MLAIRVEIVVDNSEGGDERLAEEIAQGLRDRGLAVELRPASPTAMFDTGVHLVTAGLVIRVSERPDRATPGGHRGGRPCRAAAPAEPAPAHAQRAGPLSGGRTGHIEWIDVFD